MPIMVLKLIIVFMSIAVKGRRTVSHPSSAPMYHAQCFYKRYIEAYFGVKIDY